MICSHTQSEMATLAQEMNGGTNGGNDIGRKLSMTTPGSSLSLSKFYCFVLLDNVHVHVTRSRKSGHMMH